MATQDVRATLGAVLVGGGIAAILTGVVATQTVYYFQHCHDDKPLKKLMVAVVWFLDALHTFMIFASVWLWLVKHFGEVGIAHWIPWPLGVTVVLTALVTFIVHLFFIKRIYDLSKGNWFVVGPMLVLAFLRLGFASTTCAKMMIYASIPIFVAKVSWVFTLGLVTSSVLDVVITSCLLWYLDQARTGFDGMDQIVNTLSLYAVENGLITCVAVLISLGFWLGMKGNLVFMATHFVVAKLYANSLLAALNNRERVRGNRGTSHPEGPQVVNIHRATQKRSMECMVQITREKAYVKRDEEDGFVLSPIKESQGEKDFMETATTSKTDTVVEYLTMR